MDEVTVIGNRHGDLFDGHFLPEDFQQVELLAFGSMTNSASLGFLMSNKSPRQDTFGMAPSYR